MNDNLKESQIVDQAKKEMTSATRKPTPPTSVSIMVQVLRVVFSSMPTRLLTSQKPESLKWEQTVAPPAIAAVTQASYSGLSSLMPGIAEMMPAAMVIATVEEPTEMRTSAATMKATRTSGRLALATALPMTSPRPEFWSI